MLHVIRLSTALVRWSWTGAGIGLICTTFSYGQAQRPEHPYAVFELPSLGGPHSYGWKVSEWGDVIGSATLPDRDFHPTLWIDGQTPIDLGTLGGNYGECRGVNNNGWIVGYSTVPGQGLFDGSAFLWSDGVMENLGYLGTGDFAEAYDVNDLNQIVGRSSIDPNGELGTRAFIWQEGRMSQLTHTPEYRSTEAIAINNSALIVGQASSWEFSTWRAVIWRDGEIVDLGTFRRDNGGHAICIDVNETGDVVGYAARDYLTFQAFIYRNGERIALPEEPYWRNSYAWSINDNRQIVGGARMSAYGNESIGVIWEWNRRVRHLVHLIPPKAGWFLGSALNINNAGQITGTGYRFSEPDYTKGYLLTPVNPTMTLEPPSPGLAGAENTITVKRVTPGATVTFMYSRKGGGASILNCTLQQNALQLDSPTVIGAAIADGNGVASITRTVPPIARGQTILFQALVQNECAISQLVVHRFE